LAQRGLFF